MKLPEKLTNLTPYIPVTDSYKIRLDANESSQNLPPAMCERISREISNISFNRYPDPSCRALREAASRLYNVPAAQIIPGNGSDELISVIINAFLPRGGKLMTARPDFSMYSFYAELAECEIVCYDKGESMEIDPEAFIGMAKREAPDMIMFSNPCNPTGRGLRADEVLRIARELPCIVVVDEAYMDFWSESILDYLPGMANVIILRTCSKAFGLASIRLGFAIASERLALYLDAARSPFNVNTLTQTIGCAVLSDAAFLQERCAYLRDMAAQLRAGADALAAKYPRLIRTCPTVTNFALIITSRAKAIHEKLLRRGIGIRLLGEGMLRITAGSADEHSALFAALEEILKEEQVV